ncbi:MAG: DUF72 domain-containing protein [Promethearchaeota archaeon]|jgi:uncharacterized protein YecE (DUF72 family)
MVSIKIGTAGWDYKDWVGPFYPKQLERTRYLPYYSKVFDIVEINSTFYNLPTETMVINWKNRVPENFKFIVKVWQKITHNLNEPDLELFINQFFSVLALLSKKIEYFLLQFPPWFKYTESHLKKLNLLLKEIPSEFKYIIELRDNSWFNQNILSNFIDGEKIILATTYKPGIIPHYLENQTNYYIRLIGDRELTIFNQIQRDQKQSLSDLTMNIEKILKIPTVYEIFIIVNNHFAGFAPESVNELKKQWGLSYHQFSTQKSLFDFLK